MRKGRGLLKVISRAEKRKLPQTSHHPQHATHRHASVHVHWHTHTHTNSECLRKAGIVGRCNNRSWQLSLADPRLSAAIALGTGCVFLCVCEVTHGLWQWSEVKCGVWLTSDALNQHQTLRESYSLWLVGVIPLSSHPSIPLFDCACARCIL